jgi:uncharacterized protein YndB with AHSA1/START domain
MTESRFVYVTYVRTTPERLWEGLTQPEFTRRYWNGVWHDAEWRVGATWKLMFPDGRVADSGEIEACEPPWRLALRWRNEFRPELQAEGYSRCLIEIEREGGICKLTITHSIDRADSKLIEAVGSGWPRLMASLKSLLETGQPLPERAA